MRDIVGNTIMSLNRSRSGLAKNALSARELHQAPAAPLVKQNKYLAQSRLLLSLLDLPNSDSQTIQDSTLRFEDGAQFRIEVPTINSSRVAAVLLKEAHKKGIVVNRLTETLGMFRHTKREIGEYVCLCDDYNCDLFMSVGPRAPYDTSATASSNQGSFIGYRLRGANQISRAIEDVLRGIELGIENFVIYDEGLLMVLGELRSLGKLPAHISFKASAHCGHGNPASARLLERLGANSINPVRDLPIEALAAIRAAISVPLDCHTDNPKGSGGFIRFYEAPEFVRVAAPVYLKVGNSVLVEHGSVPSVENIYLILNQVEIVLEFIERYLPDAIQSI